MRSYAEAKAAHEYATDNTPEARVARDKCPKCNGDLDTGWECTDCGFDAMSIALALPKEDGR